MRRRVVDTSNWDPNRPPSRPSGKRRLKATPAEQAIAKQMDRREREDELDDDRPSEWENVT